MYRHKEREREIADNVITLLDGDAGRWGEIVHRKRVGGGDTRKENV